MKKVQVSLFKKKSFRAFVNIRAVKNPDVKLFPVHINKAWPRKGKL